MIEETYVSFWNALKGRELYLFGASEAGKGFLKRNEDRYKIKGFFDNNSKKWGKKIGKYEILSPKQLTSLDQEKTVILVTSVFFQEIKEQLEKLGFSSIYSSYACEERQTNWLAPIKEEDYNYIEKLRAALSDEPSKKKLDHIVEYRKNKIQDWSDLFDGQAYFIEELKIGKEEIFLDGGAFEGDTIDGFLTYTKHKFKKIYAFEPDNKNFSRLAENYKEDSNIVCIHGGLWNENTSLKFDEKNTVESCISQTGSLSVPVYCIDEKLDGEVTFIKFDIEGAEQKALEGAKHTIMKYKPKLAICVYHGYDDLWKLPLYIKQLVPEYKLYLRHHSFGCGETVLYAAI